jgi:PmbA protein
MLKKFLNYIKLSKSIAGYYECMRVDVIDRIISNIKALAKEHRVEGYEVYVSETNKLSLSIDDKKNIEKLQTDEEQGIAIRTLKDQRLGFSFNYNLSDLAIEETFKRALDSGAILNKESFSFVEGKEDRLNADQFYDGSLDEITGEKKLEILSDMVDAACIDKRIVKVERPTYEELVNSTFIANSEGVLKSYKVTRFNISLSVLAKEDKESQMAWNFQGANTFSHLNPKKVARDCSEQAIQTLGGIQLITGFYNVLLTPFVTAQFLNVLSNSFKADAVYKKTSMLGDKLKQKVFPEHISIFDDPELDDGSGSVPFDAEGVPSYKKAIVEKGVISSFLYDRHYALLMQKRTTGNSVRHSITQPPSIGITNLALYSSNSSEQDARVVLSEGPVITELMGLHTVNSITGEFSLGARGYLIKSGRFSSPCKHITISGNLFELFNNIEFVGRDHMLYANMFCPSVIVQNLKISGAGG